MKDFLVCLFGHWKQIVPCKAVIFKNLSPVQFILKTSRYRCFSFSRLALNLQENIR